jgi:hypothetical protein
MDTMYNVKYLYVCTMGSLSFGYWGVFLLYKIIYLRLHVTLYAYFYTMKN